MDALSTTADVFLCRLSPVGQKPSKTTFLERFSAALTVHMGADASSPTEVGKFIGVRKQTAARWLSGKGEPGPAMLFRIADKTKVSARWLALDDVPMQPQIELSSDERETITQIFRVLQRNPKALRKWIRDGHELVEMSTPVGPGNPFSKAA